jgi:hypothetical protein
MSSPVPRPSLLMAEAYGHPITGEVAKTRCWKGRMTPCLGFDSNPDTGEALCAMDTLRYQPRSETPGMQYMGCPLRAEFRRQRAEKGVPKPADSDHVGESIRRGMQ